MCNSQGLKIEQNFFATGLAGHYTKMILETEWKENMTEEEARALIVKCLTVMFYRDKKANDRVQIATVTKDGTKIDEPFGFETNWTMPSYVE